jgi:ferredoxin
MKTCSCARETASMTYVITEPCIGAKEQSCVDVCPVDCIHSDEASEQYFIDCGACVAACPVDAIYAQADLPDDQTDFLARNAAYFV